jgi:hypothetical protein
VKQEAVSQSGSEPSSPGGSVGTESSRSAGKSLEASHWKTGITLRGSALDLTFLITLSRLCNIGIVQCAERETCKFKVETSENVSFVCTGILVAVNGS